MAVVDQLEVVEVDQDQRERRAVAPRPGQLARGLLEEDPPVGQPGQGVGRRQPLVAGLAVAPPFDDPGDHREGQRRQRHRRDRAAQDRAAVEPGVRRRRREPVERCPGVGAEHRGQADDQEAVPAGAGQGQPAREQDVADDGAADHRDPAGRGERSADQGERGQRRRVEPDRDADQDAAAALAPPGDERHARVTSHTPETTASAAGRSGAAARRERQERPAAGQDRDQHDRVGRGHEQRDREAAIRRSPRQRVARDPRPRGSSTTRGVYGTDAPPETSFVRDPAEPAIPGSAARCHRQAPGVQVHVPATWSQWPRPPSACRAAPS